MLRATLRTPLNRITRRNFSGLTIKGEATSPGPQNSKVPVNYEPPQPTPTIDTPKPIPKLTKTVSVWRVRTLWFCIGASVSGIIGYMKLVDEVRQANTDLKVRLQSAHADVTTLHARIKDIESRVAQLETHSTLDVPFKEINIKKDNV